MSTAQTWQMVTESAEATLELGASIGRTLKGGEVIELVSDVGGGKTTLVRGIAAGLGSRDHVSSPSFTISNVYQAGKISLHHYDFYRINDAGIMAAELAETLADETNIAVIEWAGLVADVLPTERLRILIKSTGEMSRQLAFECPKAYDQLITLISIKQEQ